ncbi:MAG: hypothetical protein VX015_02755 [Planctomycetota bacterium]|nr:hypothetical protein [Planctomycetota bacterium]
MASRHLFTLTGALLALVLCTNDSASARQRTTGVNVATGQTRPIVQGAGPWTAARRLLGRSLTGPGLQGNAMATRLSNNALALISATAAPASSESGTPLVTPSAGGTAYNLKLVIPSTGLEEFFSLHVPALPPGVERPMVVGFHSFRRSHLEVSLGTDLLTEAAARNWFFLAPVQRSAVGDPFVNYGSVQSQEHVEVLIRWVMDIYAVDRDRVYGVGHSMGGGSAMSFAARHRDCDAGAFAAVANHTGTVCVSNVWDVEPVVRPELELLFGGTPAEERFEYQRSSTVDLDPNGALIPQGRHMATNLAFVDTRTYYASNDTLTYLSTQSQSLTAFMQSLPFALYEEIIVVAPSECLNLPPGFPDGHCWESVDTADLYDWFESKSLVEMPPFGRCLADRSGRWYGFDVFQEQPGAFSSFDFVADRVRDLIEVTSMENVRGLNVDLSALDLRSANPLEVQLSSADGTGHLVSLMGVDDRPTLVTRNGLVALERCSTGSSPSWCYDDSTEVLTLIEPFGAAANWKVTTP